MKGNVRRIMMLSATLALIGLLVISTAALAKGPDGATQSRTQARSGDAAQTQLQTRTQSQLQTGTQSQDREQLRLHDGTCGTSTGSQAQNGNGYGPGDGTGPIGGGSFGLGPKGQCIDLNENGICDCKE